MRNLRSTVDAEALKLIRRYETYARELAEESVRRSRRSTSSTPRLQPMRPEYWALASGFDPYRVRSNAGAITHAIESAIRARGYRPRSPYGYLVPKPDGGERLVSVFQVADNAVSRLVYLSLIRKNLPKLSAHSYAYRRDLSAHDAIQYIQAEFATRDRLFIAEFDFSKYFDTIDHKHIWETIDEQRFLMTDVERRIVEAFLSAPLPRTTEYSEFEGTTRTEGVPQGTSISLFLANIAAAPLDRALERIGVGFVRYADDTIIWSPDYGRICEAVDALFEASKSIGASLNPTKSEGIRLLVTPELEQKAEFRSTTEVKFVGYEVGLHALEMKSETVERAKRHLQQLLYFNLLSELHKGTQDPGRLQGRVDRDYVVFIWQARRYLYGDLSENDLRTFERNGAPLRRFKGLMSFYPLVDDTDLLADLDAWFAAQSWLALRRRARLLRAAGIPALPPPHDLGIHDLIRYTRKSKTTGGVLDLRLPSFRRISSVIRRAAARYGPNAVGQGPPPYGY